MTKTPFAVFSSKTTRYVFPLAIVYAGRRESEQSVPSSAAVCATLTNLVPWKTRYVTPTSASGALVVQISRTGSLTSGLRVPPRTLMLGSRASSGPAICLHFARIGLAAPFLR